MKLNMIDIFNEGIIFTKMKSAAQLRSELDAYCARLYSLTRDELRYILDPKEVHGEDFPGETFRVLKEKEVRLHGSIGRQGWCWRHGMGRGKDEGGMMKDELGYVRVVREMDVRLYGEYRTSRLVLEASDGQGQG